MTQKPEAGPVVISLLLTSLGTGAVSAVAGAVGYSGLLAYSNTEDLAVAGSLAEWGTIGAVASLAVIIKIMTTYSPPLRREI